MAEFITKCPHCNSDLQVQDEWVGMEVECPECNAVFEIISTTEASPDKTQREEQSVAETEKEGSFTFVCPSCGSVEELSSELLGTDYECQACFEKHTATATTERNCPFCGKTVKYHAKICKYCKSDLSKVPLSTPQQEKFFIFICPECDTVAELPESMIGEKYECNSCCETSIVKEAEERKCPSCGEKIKIKATICKHCKANIKPLEPKHPNSQNVILNFQKEMFSALKNFRSEKNNVSQPQRKTKSQTQVKMTAPTAPTAFSPAPTQFSESEQFKSFSIIELFKSVLTILCTRPGLAIAFAIFLAVIINCKDVLYTVYVFNNHSPALWVVWGNTILTIFLSPLLCWPIYNAMLLHRNERFTPGTVFTSIGFGEWLHFVWGFCRVSLIVSLWSLLFIIPGIIAMLKYSMTNFILLDHRELSVKEAMNLSAEITMGNKFKIFYGCLLIGIIPIVAYCILYYYKLYHLPFFLSCLLAPFGSLYFAGIYEKIKRS